MIVVLELSSEAGMLRRRGACVVSAAFRHVGNKSGKDDFPEDHKWGERIMAAPMMPGEAPNFVDRDGQRGNIEFGTKMTREEVDRAFPNTNSMGWA